MTGLPYDDEELDNYCWVKIPIATEQREDPSLSSLPQDMDIDDLPKPEADTDVIMVDAVTVKPFVYNRDDGDVQQRTGKVHGRSKSMGKSHLGKSSPLREASVTPVHDERANKSPDSKVVVPESDAQRQARVEEAKAAANNDPSKPEDENDDEFGDMLMVELENPADEKASSPDLTSSANITAPATTSAPSTRPSSTAMTNPAAMHLARSREELNDERCKSLLTPVIAPDRESLIEQVCLLRKRTETLERRLQEYEQGTNAVVVDQQREIEDLRRSLQEAKNWAEDGPILVTLYQKLKDRNEKLENELDEAMAKEQTANDERQAAIDEKDDLVKVIESMRDMQLNSPGMQQTFTHKSQSIASESSSVLQAAAANKKPEIREFVPPASSQQSSDKTRSGDVTDKSLKSSEKKSKKKLTTSSSPKANPRTNKLESDLAATRHQLSGCHKNTRIHKRQIWELRNEVKALTDDRSKDLQTIERLTEAQQADLQVMSDASQEMQDLTKQLTESQAQNARLEAKGNAKDTVIRKLRETNDVLKDELTASRLEAKDLIATVETLAKDNRALTLAQSDPARYEHEIAELKKTQQEGEAENLKLQESLDACLEENKTMSAELDQLRKTYDEEAIYRNRAIARKNETSDLRATAVPRAELTAIEAEKVSLERVNADLIAEREELKAETAWMITALEYAREKIETISRAGPPATSSQQRTMYAEVVARVRRKSERAQAMREIKQVLAEQREESFRSMRLSVWDMEEEWKVEFGMAGAYCKDLSSKTLPIGDRSG